MEDIIFKTIKEFCKNNKYPVIYNRILLHKFYEDFYKVTSDHKLKQGIDPSADTITGFQSTLLNDMTLKSNVKLAEDELKTLTSYEVNKFKLIVSFKQFTLDVVSGIIATIIYTVLLILFFYLGKNQINSWLNDLKSEDPTPKSENK